VSVRCVCHVHVHACAFVLFVRSSASGVERYDEREMKPGRECISQSTRISINIVGGKDGVMRHGVTVS
jgi:hypothetical protein